MTPNAIINVMVGILCNQNHKVLIAKRPTKMNRHLLWEFPGGKVGHDDWCDYHWP